MWSVWHSKYIDKLGNSFTVATSSPNTYAVIQLDANDWKGKPFLYFELTITKITRLPPIIGLGLAPRGYSAGMTGWETPSVGYHSDDGIFFCGQFKKQHDAYGLKDTVGIFWNLSSGSLLITKNGKEFSPALERSPSLDLLPTVTAEYQGDAFTLNMGEAPFKWEKANQMKGSELNAAVDAALALLQKQWEAVKAGGQGGKAPGGPARFVIDDETLRELEKADGLEETLKNLKESTKKLEGFIQEKQACVVCLSEKKGMVFVPCGHLACCPSCAAMVGNCPMCRTPITQKVKVFH